MNKRILFVDDDPLLLEFHALTMEKAAAHWEIIRAENNGQALEILAATKFDVVVADLRQPDMDGRGLMHEVQRLHPRITRICVSGLDDRDKAARNLESANQFLANVTTKELFATLLRIGKMDAVLSDEKLKALASQLDSQPSAHAISLQIIHELNSDNPSIEAMADLALQDPALTEKLIHAANSATFGRKTKVGNVLEAIQYIGLNIVRSIVLSAHVFRDFEHTDLKKFSAKQLWDSALRRAEITNLILRLEKQEAGKAQDADTANLLCNISKLMLAKNSVPHERGQTFSRAVTPNVALPDVGRKTLDVSRTGGATNIFGLWGLATPMVEAVAFQLQPVGNETQPQPLPDGHIVHPRPSGFVPNYAFGRPPAPDFDFPTDINANDRRDSLRADVQKLFPHDA